MILDEGFVQLWEFLSYVVTVLGLPIAIYAVWRELRAERENEHTELEQREDEIYVRLSQEYSRFLEVVLQNPELDLLSELPLDNLTPEQKKRREIYYEMLMALFERAFILLHEKQVTPTGSRRWASWADFFAYWLRRPGFRHYVATNVEGEDAAFVAFIRQQLEQCDHTG